jgi:hypothetical protein
LQGVTGILSRGEVRRGVHDHAPARSGADGTGSGLLSASFQPSFQQATLADIASGFGVALPGSIASLWEITGGTGFQGTAQLTFAYDPALLPVGFDETQLAIAHLEGGIWELLTGAVDADANTITVETDSFSPFSLVSMPEPAPCWLLLAGLLPVAWGRARRSWFLTEPFI